ncbi:MAG: hypothetical protein O3A48_04530 [Actinomycetota bacterium]|nr:hypothetical protein [Actinomycetota bacterium]
MKYKSVIKYLLVLMIFSACEVKWDMKIKFNDDLSGNYSIAVLIDQEAQLYALDTGQSSIGGLDSILSNLPEGFGSSIYQEGDYLGILVRNTFADTDEFLLQLELLKSEENTALLLLPVKEINFLSNEREFIISGKFAEIFVTDEENLEGFKNIFEGMFSLQVPGSIIEPKIENIVDNTIIFENDGLSIKSFQLITRTKPILSTETIALIVIVIIFLINYFVRHPVKKN